MSFNDIELTLPSNFDNRTRLFPLPELVLFPGVVQALHIFEPRYRVMLEDALSDDRLISLVRLEADRGVNEFGLPAIAQTACIGQVLSETRLDDGRYNLFLVGIRRAKILSEPIVDKPYRVANVELLDDLGKGEQLEAYRSSLVDQLCRLMDGQPGWIESAVTPLLDPTLPLSQVVDMICYAAGLPSDDQQRVLDTPDVAQRAALVTYLLDQQLLANRQQTSREFPPRFSLN